MRLGALPRRALLALPALLRPAAARADAYPPGPVRIVVPFPPGATDFLPRLAAPGLSVALGQPVIVENRDGASGMIGSAFVARAAPDGTTLLLTTPSSHLTPLFLSRNMPYDPVRDFTPISAAAEAATCLAVAASMPAQDAAALLALARARPGTLTYGSSGIGSVFHMAGAVLDEAAGVETVHVPFRGTGPAMTALLGGQISMVYCALADALPGVAAGRVRILALLEAERFAPRPELPTLAEAVPGFRKPASWFGLFGPARLPAAIADRVQAALLGVLRAPAVTARLDEVGIRVVGSTPAAFAEQLQAGIVQYGAIVRAAGLHPE